MRNLSRSILAGIMIGIAGTAYLLVDNKVVGALLFIVGIFMVVVRDLKLFTGKVGYLLDNRSKYIIDLLVILFGNLIGAIFTGFLISATRINDLIGDKIMVLSDLKLNDSPLSIFIMSIFCGLLVYLAVDGYYKSKEKDLGCYLGLFLGIIVFVVCGFEHCIANMFYFTLAGSWNLNSIIYILIMVLGNGLGALIFPVFNEKLTNCDV